MLLTSKKRMVEKWFSVIKETANGIDLDDNQAVLLKKIEELALCV